MEGSWNSINQYPRIDMYKTGQNMKNMIEEGADCPQSAGLFKIGDSSEHLSLV